MTPTLFSDTPRARARSAWSLSGLLALAALAALAPSAAASHPTPPCFDDHDGLHLFPLTAGKAELGILAGPFAGTTVELELVGPTLVDAQATGPATMETQILDMNLVGADPVVGPVHVTVSPVEPSEGSVVAASSTACYPASSSFAVMVEVVNPFPAHAHTPKYMSATLTDIPPQGGVFYEDPQTILLYAGPSHVTPPPPGGDILVAYLASAQHTPTPQCMDDDDNDFDGTADFPLDADCESFWDNDEAPGNNTTALASAAARTLQPGPAADLLPWSLLLLATLAFAGVRRR